MASSAPVRRRGEGRCADVRAVGDCWGDGSVEAAISNLAYLNVAFCYGFIARSKAAGVLMLSQGS
jgi:predicted transport protein